MSCDKVTWVDILKIALNGNKNKDDVFLKNNNGISYLGSITKATI